MDRLYRFSIPGVVFFIASWFFIYALTGNNLLCGKDLIKDIFPVLLSTPIIGLILTTFFHAFLHWKKCGKRPGPYWYYLPKKLDEILFVELNKGEKPDKKKEWKKFYWNYQAYSRENLKSETIEFLTRRWTYCFIHYNNFWALGSAWLFSLIFKLCFTNCSYVQPCLLIIGLIITGLYVVCGWYLASFALNDAKNVEHRAVSNSLEEHARKRGREASEREKLELELTNLRTSKNS